jgi:hypothetical protein
MQLLKTKPKDETIEPLRLGVNFEERDAAMSELRAAIARILQPRSGYTLFSGSGGMHFLPTPSSPEVPIQHNGMLGKPTKEQALAFQEELTRITIRERELVDAAQAAKNVVADELSSWLQDMALTEARLGMSVLAEEDRADVEAFEREHRRFIRTCRTLAAQLDF